jgi:tetratricopeptide (TPR) repeat protein
MMHVKHLLIAFLLCSSLMTYAQFRLYEKGHDSYKAGKYEDAIANLTEYLTKSTRDKSIDIDVFYIRALSHYKLNHFKEAVPDFEETILRGHTNKGNIYWFMAKCYDNLRNNTEAINYYNNAVRELSDKREQKAKLLFDRSEVYYRSGDLKTAYNDLRESQSADPSNTDVKVRIERIEKQWGTGQVITARQTEVSKQEKEVKRSSAPDSEITTQRAQTENPVHTQQAPAISALQEFYKDERRYALVIGNSGYPKQIGALRNPLNDATDIAEELRNSHFDVTLLTDATYGQIRAALMKFKEKLDGGDPEKTVGLFYYAGHGLQFEDENYLVPLDASVEYEDDIPRYCFPINRMVLANMERSNTRMNIVILDACRNNPFPSLHRSLGNSGLGEMKRAKGSFIAYATAPGSVASDGTGRNGLYTQELLKALKKPGLAIEQVFKEVRTNVLRLSNNKQNTWDSSNILGEFHFKY